MLSFHHPMFWQCFDNDYLCNNRIKKNYRYLIEFKKKNGCQNIASPVSTTNQYKPFASALGWYKWIRLIFVFLCLQFCLLQITLIHRSLHSLIKLAQLQQFGTALPALKRCRNIFYFNSRYPFQNKIIFVMFIFTCITYF